MLESIVNLLSSYQTISIIFVSSFLTIICLSKKTEDPSGPASNFNTIETLNEKKNETEIEIIALDNNNNARRKSLDNSINSANQSTIQNNKSKIPIRRNNQISNSFEDTNSSKKLKVTYDNDTNNNNNSKASSNNNKPNLFTVSTLNSPLDVSINNSIPSSAATQTVNLTPNTSARKSFNNIKPLTNDDPKQNTNKSPQLNRNTNTPTKIEIIHEDDNRKPPAVTSTSGLPPRNPQYNPRPSITLVNNNNNNSNANTNSNLTSSNSFNSGNNTNRFRNSIVDVNGRISSNINANRVQISQPDAKTTSPIAEKNYEDPKTKAQQQQKEEPPILSAPKILKKAMDKIQPKSNLKHKDKSSYKLLQNENNNHIKKNKKSVKFHNKVEVWARTPTFLYSEKSFGDRDLDDYDDDDEVDNLKRIRHAAQSGRRLFIPDKSLLEPIPIVTVPRPLAATSTNQVNGYSNRLRTKLATSSVPANQFTDSTIPIIPAYPAHHFRPTILQPRITPFTPFRPGPAPIAVTSNIVGPQQAFLYNPIQPAIAIRTEMKPSPRMNIRAPLNKPASTVK